jgi:alpha-ketoglutarate-dependent taurine dioxygenase
MSMLTIERLTETIGAEVSGFDVERLLHDEAVPELVLDALDAHGVLVFPGLGLDLDDDTQVQFCERLAPVTSPPVQVISLDPAKAPNAEYLKGSFDWHFDGAQDDVPHLAALSTAVVITAADGGTEFVSTYGAYDRLSDDEKERFASVRVVHDLGAHQRRRSTDPTPEQLERWAASPKREHPLVWTHRSGRRSLVIGATADHVVGLSYEAGRELLEDLLERASRPEHVFSHDFAQGDTIMWDNRGVLHRAAPYAHDSPREMHRTFLRGDEPIQ